MADGIVQNTSFQYLYIDVIGTQMSDVSGCAMAEAIKLDKQDIVDFLGSKENSSANAPLGSVMGGDATTNKPRSSDVA